MTRKERKQKRREKRKASPKLSSTLTELAWQMARIMTSTPQRKHQGDMIINHRNEIGCIPMGGSQSDYYYCKDCWLGGFCQDFERSGKSIKWRLSENGTLTRRI